MSHQNENSTSCGCASRRKFLTKAAGGVASAGLAGISIPGVAWAWGVDEREAETCGPPPPAKPQSRTGGESFPPLPLPVTPLRRTEKKRPPAPPALIGKMALGKVRWVTRDGKRVAYRDWMTDPSDIQSLLNWTNEKLGIHYRSLETDFEHFSFDPRELPALLFSGHNHFELDEPILSQLSRYVMDGGMLIGDACCGWKDFDESFREVVAKIFPDRPLRKLSPDDPLFASYYKLGGFTYQQADGSKETAAPCLEGVTLGCRLGVVYSPVDLTCGWDGHDHPRGLRVVIDQARQIGANYVTYLLGNYQLARFLSTTKVYHESQAPTRDDFVFAQLIHERDWDPDPSSVHNLLKYAKENSTLEVKFKRANVRLKDPRTAGYPLLYMTGHEEFRWTDEEVNRLKNYLRAGGMLLADACCGRLAFDAAFRREIARVFPANRLAALPQDHPLLHIHAEIEQVQYTPRVVEDFGAIPGPMLEGITLDGRVVVVYSRFDLGNGWEEFPHPYAYGYQDQDALKIGTNVLVYAVTH